MHIGNCKTAMVATLSLERGHLDESISTARFAQRVALIKNSAVVNEELDPKLLIAQLRGEIRQEPLITLIILITLITLITSILMINPVITCRDLNAKIGGLNGQDVSTDLSDADIKSCIYISIYLHVFIYIMYNILYLKYENIEIFRS